MTKVLILPVLGRMSTLNNMSLLGDVQGVHPPDAEEDEHLGQMSMSMSNYLLMLMLIVDDLQDRPYAFFSQPPLSVCCQ